MFFKLEEKTNEVEPFSVVFFFILNFFEYVFSLGDGGFTRIDIRCLVNC